MVKPAGKVGRSLRLGCIRSSSKSMIIDRCQTVKEILDVLKRIRFNGGTNALNLVKIAVFCSLIWPQYNKVYRLIYLPELKFPTLIFVRAGLMACKFETTHSGIGPMETGEAID